LADELAQCRHRGEPAFRDRRIDARQILKYHPAGADIGVADLGIPHLPVGQADIMLARLELRMRPPRDQSMPVRRLRHFDRVVVGLRSLAPSVENAQHQWTGAGAGVHRGGPWAMELYLYTRNRPRADSAPDLTSTPMVRMPGEDLLRAIELFEQHPPDEQVRPG